MATGGSILVGKGRRMVLTFTEVAGYDLSKASITDKAPPGTNVADQNVKMLQGAVVARRELD